MEADREYEGCKDESRRRLSVAERDALAVIKADLGEWLSRILDAPLLTAEGFMSGLDTGVLLCRLARRIQERARELQQEWRGAPPPPVEIPMGRVACSKEAERESFYARDNASNFISWCQQLGVGEAVLFESEGLVMHRDERRVVLCLLEVARRTTAWLGLPTPNLIKMEIEMDQESVTSSETDIGDSPQHKPLRSADPTHLCGSQLQEASNGSLKEEGKKLTSPPPASKDPSPHCTPLSRKSSTSSESSPPLKKVRQLSQVDQDVSRPTHPVSAVARPVSHVPLPRPQVMQICGRCQCAKKIGVRCLKSGKFELTVSGDKKVVIFVRVSVTTAHKSFHHTTITGPSCCQ